MNISECKSPASKIEMDTAKGKLKKIVKENNFASLDDVANYLKNIKEGQRTKISKLFIELLKEEHIVDLESVIQRSEKFGRRLIEMNKNFSDFFENEKVKNFIKALPKAIDNLEEVDKDFKKLNKLKQIATPKTVKEINNFLDSEMTSVDDLRDFVLKIEGEINYMTIHQSAEMNAITNSFSNLKRKDMCLIEMLSGDGQVKTNNLTYKISNFRNLKKEISISTSKLLVCAINKINFRNNISTFTFDEYSEMRSIKKTQKNRNKLKKDLLILESLSHIKYETTHKKDNDLILTTLVIEAVYKNGNVIIEFNPKFADGLKNTYMYFPRGLIKLNGKQFKNAFLLGWYIFAQLRINFTTSLKRSVKKCLEQLTLPRKENVKRRYQQLIIEPFEAILEVLGDKVPGLYITFDRDYNNINDFLNANIIIELLESNIAKVYANQQRKKISKDFKSNTKNKESNLILCEKYTKDGLSNQEISKLLGKSVKTIRRYKSEIAKKKTR
jgi:hypothetical protein